KMVDKNINMKTGYTQVLLTLFMLGLCVNTQAQDTTRNAYSLFKPLPGHLIHKDMPADRADMTETPLTVDVGHFQYETDLVSYERELSGDKKQQHWLYNQANLKLGILKNTDIQFGIQSYGRDITQNLDGTQKETDSGFGDITIRLKQCLYGNYSGNFSIALLPYVKIPTNNYNGNNSVEAGLIIPMEFDLPKDWGLGTQVKGDYVKNDDGPGYHGEIMQSVSVSHQLYKQFDLIGETSYTYNFKDHEIQNFLNAVIAFNVNKNVILDAGLYYGVQKEASNVYFLGISFGL
ncbi:MAG: transporter, partial [Sphingobacteriaceae bacterium]